jgi:choline dehydrogenase
MAAGSLQTTKILYHSGIGPQSILDAFGIPHRVVNDVIGQKIRNHQRVSMIFNDINGGNANFYGSQAAHLEYASQGTGLVANRGYVFVHFNSSVPSYVPYPDLQASPNTYAPGTGLTLSQSDAYAQQFIIIIGLNHNAYANGTLNLTSSDPLAPTFFTANLFVMEDDINRGLSAIAEVRRLVTFWPGRVEEVSPGTSYTTPDQLTAWIKATGATTFCHYYGTHPMGTNPTDPCTPRMMLNGVQRLRLVGPAIIPQTVYPGMQMLSTVLGEKGTDLIKEDHGL